MSMDDAETRLPPGAGESGGYLRAGQRFGQYEVKSLLGRGGMGEVYAVKHRVFGTEHAIKLINREIAGRPDARERFEKEAKVMNRLRHPHIVHVDEFGETDGLTWLRMELVGKSESGKVGKSGGVGSSLADKLKAEKGKLNEDEAREILRQILEGLAYAHGQGVVHRDLKPGNVLLEQAAVGTGQGAEGGGQRADISDQPSGISHSPALRALIADFGLVKLAGEQWIHSQVQKSVARSMSMSDRETVGVEGAGGSGSAGTSTKALLGTYAYMSPEQKKGEEADARSDMYAVGLMAYQMLTGADTPGFKAPSRLNPEISSAWDGWIEKAMEPDPSDRFADAGEMLAALPERRALAADGRGVDEGGGSKRSASRWIIAAVLLLAAGAGAWWWGTERSDSAVVDEMGPLEAVSEKSATEHAPMNIDVVEERINDQVIGQTQSFEDRERTAALYWIVEEANSLMAIFSGYQEGVEDTKAEWLKWEKTLGRFVDFDLANASPDALPESPALLENLKEERDALALRTEGILQQVELSRDRVDFWQDRKAAHLAFWEDDSEEIVRDVLVSWSILQKNLKGLTTLRSTLDERLESAKTSFSRLESRMESYSPTGSLSVKTEPHGWVRLEGFPEQTSPAVFSSLSPGSYRLLAGRDGYEELELMVEIAENVRLDLGVLELKAVMSSLDFVSHPSGTMVFDLSTGKHVGTTPIKNLSLPPGFHRFRFETEGFLSASKVIELESGGRAQISVDLKPLHLPKAGEDWIVEELGLVLVWIEPGEFVMGSPPGESGRSANEGPQTVVRLDHGFWIARTETTIQQFAVFADDSNARDSPVDLGNGWRRVVLGAPLPVTMVNWHEAMAFCRWLTERERAAGRLSKSLVFSLPTEAEWEYACRAGTRSAFYFGDNARHLYRFGNYADRNTYFNYSDMRHDDGYHEVAPVGRFGPNAWGLHDMHGNVAEWCLDWSARYLPGGKALNPSGPEEGRFRVVRGGSWRLPAHSARSAARGALDPNHRSEDLGFRIVLRPSE